MSEAALIVRHDEGIQMVEFARESLLDPLEVDEVERELKGLVEPLQRPKIVLSFTNVTRVSSMLLGVLVKLQGWVRRKQGDLKLSSLSKHVGEIFELTKLDQAFGIYETEADARRAL